MGDLTLTFPEGAEVDYDGICAALDRLGFVARSVDGERKILVTGERFALLALRDAWEKVARKREAARS